MSTTPLEHGLTLREPATRWQDALSIGNGTLGALIYGHIAEERIVWNHDAYWLRSAKPQLNDMSGELPQLRAMLAQGDFAEARDHWNDSAKAPFGIDPYQPAFALEWKQTTGTPFTQYRRHLDFERSEAQVEWSDQHGQFKRTAFISQPDQVGVLHLEAPEGVTPTIRIRLLAHESDTQQSMGAGGDVGSRTGALKWETHLEPNLIFYHGSNEITNAYGTATSSCSGALSILVPEGSVSIEDDTLIIAGASQVTVLVMAIAHESRDIAWNGLRHSLLALPDYPELRKRHLARQSELSGRTVLRIGPHETPPADVAMIQQQGADGHVPTEWIAALHDFGRYLLCSSSWPGDFPRRGWPANLQGLWNGDYAPAWSSDIHNNVNIQMNYWPALTGALPETILPFFDYFEHFVEDYRHNARQLYGCRGIFLPISQSTHGVARPSLWNNWTAGAAWIAQHFYDYYLYTGDRDFLRDRAVPFMREAAAFYEDFCTIDESGRAHFSPSLSPENTPLNSPEPHIIVCNDATMDVIVTRELLTHLLSACRELDCDHDHWPRWQTLLDALAPYEIAPDGQFREWLDADSIDNHHHRHISHLYAVYPGWEINETTPELAAACIRSLEERLGAGLGDQTGWSLAHQAATWARLGQGDRALDCLELLARFCVGPNGLTYHNNWFAQGPTMFWGHGNPPPFQIEANFGLTAAVQEMLLQSRPDVIKLLPALPSKWSEGEFRGWNTRVGVKVDLKWRDGGKTWSAMLTATRATEFQLISPPKADAPTQLISLATDQSLSLPY